jgi:hypothetical protein
MSTTPDLDKNRSRGSADLGDVTNVEEVVRYLAGLGCTSKF